LRKKKSMKRFGGSKERAEGKGFEFLDELDRVVRLIRTFPLVALEIEPEIRRSLLARFPYALVYGIDDQTLVVIAVMHTHRQPRYWIDRLPSLTDPSAP
jgi:hypothetical protein